jgi:DNA-damage-inducible protein D
VEEQINYIISALDSQKRTAPNGQSFWVARELMELLGYTEWRNFREVIEKAKDASNNAGVFSTDHFVDIDEVITVGKGAKAKRDNCILSKHAAYLVAMNGDSTKPEIAAAQDYFAKTSIEAEQRKELTEEQRRMILRHRVKDGNKALGNAAHIAGVTGPKFGIFHDAGYKGLYNGLGRDAIKKLKGISANEDLLDCMDRVELAANEFRITQTEQKLRTENIKGEQLAIDTHHSVGRKVRQAITNIGGKMPEELPPAESIKKLVSKRERDNKKFVESLAEKKSERF